MSEQVNGNLALMPRVQMQPVQVEWDTEANLMLLRQTYAKDLSQAEFALYIEHCRQLRLNPLTKQVQPLKFDGKTLSFHTTIHGLIAIAARSGTYAGMDAVQFDSMPRGDTLGAQHPNSASVTVYRLVGGQRCPFTAEVFWVERNRGMASWKSQPWTMLGKCAQAAALRLGWEEVQGMYIEEELPSSTPIIEAVTSSPQKQLSSLGNVSPKTSHPDERQPGESSRDWCKRLGKRLGIFDTVGDYYKLMASVTKHPNPQGIINDDSVWQVWEAYLLHEIDLVEGLKEEDEGLAKMAGLDDDAGEENADA